MALCICICFCFSFNEKRLRLPTKQSSQLSLCPSTISRHNSGAIFSRRDVIVINILFHVIRVRQEVAPHNSDLLFRIGQHCHLKTLITRVRLVLGHCQLHQSIAHLVLYYQLQKICVYYASFSSYFVWNVWANFVYPGSKNRKTFLPRNMHLFSLSPSPIGVRLNLYTVLRYINHYCTRPRPPGRAMYTSGLEWIKF